MGRAVTDLAAHPLEDASQPERRAKARWRSPDAKDSTGAAAAALLQQACAFDPAHRRHEHVDDGHIGLEAGGCRECLLSACGLADDLQPWLACEQGLERVQEGRIV